MPRITTKQLQASAERACKAAGLNWAPHYAKQPDGRYRAVVGAVQISKCYSGWNLSQIASEGGGVRDINGHANAMKASEMQAFLRGMEIGAELAAKASTLDTLTALKGAISGYAGFIRQVGRDPEKNERFLAMRAAIAKAEGGAA